MKYSCALTAGILAATTTALPQFGLGGGSTSNELDGECRQVTFIFARGSTEPGNMGSTVGPSTCTQLKSLYGDSSVACQGVGGAYAAGLGTNALPQGTTQAAIDEAAGLLNQAATQCPDTVITAGGYSQGAAVMTYGVSTAEESTKERIHGVVLYGNTRNGEEGGKIPDFPEDEVLTICHATDGVCGATLTVTAGHLTYGPDVPEAVDFISSRIDAAGGSGTDSAGAASSSSGTSSSGSSGSDFGGLFGGS